MAKRSSVSTILFSRLWRLGREVVQWLTLERFTGFHRNGEHEMGQCGTIWSRTGETLESELECDVSPGTLETRNKNAAHARAFRHIRGLDVAHSQAKRSLLEARTSKRKNLTEHAFEKCWTSRV